MKSITFASSEVGVSKKPVWKIHCSFSNFKATCHGLHCKNTFLVLDLIGFVTLWLGTKCKPIAHESQARSCSVLKAFEAFYSIVKIPFDFHQASGDTRPLLRKTPPWSMAPLLKYTVKILFPFLSFAVFRQFWAKQRTVSWRNILAKLNQKLSQLPC